MVLERLVAEGYHQALIQYAQRPAVHDLAVVVVHALLCVASHAGYICICVILCMAGLYSVTGLMQTLSHLQGSCG